VSLRSINEGFADLFELSEEILRASSTLLGYSLACFKSDLRIRRLADMVVGFTVSAPTGTNMNSVQLALNNGTLMQLLQLARADIFGIAATSQAVTSSLESPGSEGGQDNSASSSTSIGGVVGGAVGGIAGVLILIGMIQYYRAQQKKRVSISKPNADRSYASFPDVAVREGDRDGTHGTNRSSYREAMRNASMQSRSLAQPAELAEWNESNFESGTMLANPLYSMQQVLHGYEPVDFVPMHADDPIEFDPISRKLSVHIRTPDNNAPTLNEGMQTVTESNIC
jgi:hypothetical protein